MIEPNLIPLRPWICLRSTRRCGKLKEDHPHHKPLLVENPGSHLSLNTCIKLRPSVLSWQGVDNKSRNIKLLEHRYLGHQVVRHPKEKSKWTLAPKNVVLENMHLWNIYISTSTDVPSLQRRVKKKKQIAPKRAPFGGENDLPSRTNDYIWRQELKMPTGNRLLQIIGSRPSIQKNTAHN